MGGTRISSRPEDAKPPTNKDFIRGKPRRLRDAYEFQGDFANIQGGGCGGHIRKAVARTNGQEVAVKVCHKVNAKEVCNFKREKELMRSLDHPNIVNYIEEFQDQYYMYVIMDFYRGGELNDVVERSGKLTELQASVTMQQLLRALSYLHSRHIAHRDVKLENIMLDDEGAIEQSTVKLIDFGLARTFEPGAAKMMTLVGTPYTIAPEVFQSGPNRPYTESCDVWSAGVVLYAMLSGGALPFEGPTTEAFRRQIVRGSYRFPQEDWNLVSEEAKDLTMKMLQKLPEDRICAQQALQDPWILKKGQVRSCWICSKLEAIWLSLSAKKAVAK